MSFSRRLLSGGHEHVGPCPPNTWPHPGKCLAASRDQALPRVLTFLETVCNQRFPRDAIGLRTSRRMRALAEVLDALLEGSVGRAGGLLVQWFKSVGHVSSPWRLEFCQAPRAHPRRVGEPNQPGRKAGDHQAGASATTTLGSAPEREGTGQQDDSTRPNGHRASQVPQVPMFSPIVTETVPQMFPPSRWSTSTRKRPASRWRHGRTSLGARSESQATAWRPESRRKETESPSRGTSEEGAFEATDIGPVCSALLALGARSQSSRGGI